MRLAGDGARCADVTEDGLVHYLWLEENGAVYELISLSKRSYH